MHTRAALWGGCLLLVAPAAAAAADAAEDSVVKIIASVRFPDPIRPWAKPSPQQQAGSGAVIEGKRILTNAHVVMYASEVHVQASAGDDRVEARVEAIAPDIDLAVLSVKDDKFLQKKAALVRSRKLPRVQDNVAVYGFPIGGRELSVTKGTISRLDVGHYGSRGPGFVIQISAAVNPGNSGGPALVDGKMIGVVVSRVANAQNIGSVIPNEEIDLFLDDIKDGRYDGKPVENSRVMYQALVNDALRGMLRVGADVKGVLARVPEPPDGDYPLKQFDIVTRIGKYEIDNTGMVLLENGLRAPFLYLVPRLARAGTVPFTIRRNGQALDVAMPVSTRDNRLLSNYQGEPLSYFIHGPLVFAPVKAEDISLYGQMNPSIYSDGGPLTTRRFDTVRFPGEELVVVSAPMFSHKITRGYANPVGKVVRDVNGIRVKNLRHLVETLRDSKDKHMRFHFADDFSDVLVFDKNELERATGEIMEDQGIAPARRGSADVLKIWGAKGTSR
jgi:S1-C subfamily serine protease